MAACKHSAIAHSQELWPLQGPGLLGAQKSKGDPSLVLAGQRVSSISRPRSKAFPLLSQVQARLWPHPE